MVSGIKFDLDALTERSDRRCSKLPLFLALFLVVRGAPAMLLYRRILDLRDRVALAFFSATELPLVVAITTIAIDQGHMRSSTAASLDRRRHPVHGDLSAGRPAAARRPRRPQPNVNA